MLDDSTLLADIRETLATIVDDADLDGLRAQTHLRNDLGIDSMAAVELAHGFSEKYKKDIPFERWFVAQRETDDFTVGSLMAFLKQNI